jgi:CubicO group peptidase (beta-lactamase class C family)
MRTACATARRTILAAATALLLSSAPALRAQEAPPRRNPAPAVVLDRWFVLGPVPISKDRSPAPDADQQQKAFDVDFLSSCGGETRVRPAPPPPCPVLGHDLAWKATEPSDDVVDLAKAVGGRDYAVAYALADVRSARAGVVLLGLGSDDAVKVWLNGKLVHSNWVLRALGKDQDLVPLDLREGRNQLLLKIQNASAEWSFAARSLDAKRLGEAVWTAAQAGDLDRIQGVLAHGTALDLDARAKYGLSAWQIARICGRSEAAELLASKGADASLPLPPPEGVVNAMFSELTRGEKPGAAVLVSRDGKTLFEKGYGYASLEHQAPITPETKFRIGSITKQFTASAILRLQEQGKLSVDDHLSKYLPDYPRGDQVTLRHLLTHTSGIHSYTDKPDFVETVTVPIKSAAAFIHSFENEPYDFSPGERWSYSNSGYFLLGFIVEKVSGEPYGDFLRTQFFEPLGMKDTGVYRNGDVLLHDATGYAQNGETIERARDWDMSRAGGAGALYSTVEDLARWNDALFGGRVLNKASLDAAWSPVATRANPTPTDGGYGFGWNIGSLRGLREIQHGGGLQGFVSMLSRFPDQQLTIVVLANAAPPIPGLDPGTLTHAIAEIYLGGVMAPRPSTKAVTLSPAELEPFVGRYDYGQAILAVTREGDHLFAQLTGQPRFEIFPRSANEFFWKVVDAQVTFTRDDAGRVVKAHHRQGPASFDAPRLEEQAAIALEPAVLDAYVGKYDYGQGKVVLTVTREGSQLFGQLTGQPKFEIFAKSPTEFFWKVVNAQIAFVKDENGKVIRGVHTQGGRTMDVPRIE